MSVLIMVRLGFVSLVIGCSVWACKPESTDGSDFIFNATALRYDNAAAQNYRCIVQAFLFADSLSPNAWTGEAEVHFRRDIAPAGKATVFRDTTFMTSVRAREDSGNFVLVFGPPFDQAFSNHTTTHWERFTNGRWDCRSSLPLTNDSTLQVQGYQAVPEPAGDWFFGPAVPIG